MSVTYTQKEWMHIISNLLYIQHVYMYVQSHESRVSDQLSATMYKQTLPYGDEAVQKLGNTTEM